MNADISLGLCVFTDISSSGSGQDASMALEDCEILAMLLAHHRDRDEGDWCLAAKLYSGIRIPRLLWIRQEADKRSEMKQDKGIVQEMVMIFYIWLGCELALFKNLRCALTDISRS